MTDSESKRKLLTELEARDLVQAYRIIEKVAKEELKEKIKKFFSDEKNILWLDDAKHFVGFSALIENKLLEDIDNDNIEAK
jgi:hypothetical protein